MITFPSPTDLDACRPWSDLVLKRCGLALKERQISTFADLVQARMQVRGLASCDAYFDLLGSDRSGLQEWSELVESLVSHETSFFRHPESFEAFRTHVLPELRRRPDAGRSISIWSAGCSTGEEPYSLAMVAMSDPALAGEFLVWGADISPRVIDRARGARYPDRAVQAIPEEYRRRYLKPTGIAGAEWEIDAELRRRVRFLPLNLHTADELFLSYDVIFCHNVLIYFAPPAVSRLLVTLASRLTPGGFLVLGPGEAPTECPTGLEPLALNGVRAFRRVGRTPPPSIEVRS